MRRELLAYPGTMRYEAPSSQMPMCVPLLLLTEMKVRIHPEMLNQTPPPQNEPVVGKAARKPHIHRLAHQSAEAGTQHKDREEDTRWEWADAQGVCVWGGGVRK